MVNANIHRRNSERCESACSPAVEFLAVLLDSLRHQEYLVGIKFNFHMVPLLFEYISVRCPVIRAVNIRVLNDKNEDITFPMQYVELLPTKFFRASI